MKKFALMLLMAGTPGFAGIREFGFLDFDVGPPSKEFQNSIEEAPICQSYEPLLTIDKVDDKVHHKVHTHDIPDWHILLHCRQFWPGKPSRLINQQILTDSGITGVYDLPISPEETTP